MRSMATLDPGAAAGVDRRAAVHARGCAWFERRIGPIYRTRSDSRPAKPMFHIVLFQPELPPNTANVIRLCANSGTTLHLVKPLGFELPRKAVRRAGLDYEELAPVRVHASLPACLEALQDARRFRIETGGGRPHSDAPYKPDEARISGP